MGVFAQASAMSDINKMKFTIRQFLEQSNGLSGKTKQDCGKICAK